MNFTSIPFLGLMFGVVLVLWGLQYLFKESYHYSNIVLVISSLIFCGYSNLIFCLIISLEAVAIYFIAICIEKFSRKKEWLILGILIEILALAFFKYYNFFADTFNYFGLPFKRMEILLPIGISYYTFSAIGYLVDVYRKKYSAQKDVVQMLLFMTFFPKLTAGPIISAQSFFEQSGKNRTANLHELSVGIQIILIGIIKKNVFADHIAEFTNNVYGNVSMYNAQTLILAILRL